MIARRASLRGAVLVGVAIAAAAVLSLAAGVVGPSRGAAASGDVPNVIVLGIDGMDPILLERFAAKGRMPAFERLMRQGYFARLGSSTPPQSPVAWSNFITGMDPGGHGIFDFIHRDPKKYLPTFSTSTVEEPKRVLRIGSWEIPLSKGRVELLRKGRAFWQILSEHGVDCTIFRIPSNFPPVECDAKALSGMGTPDLLGTYGTFSFFTDDPSYMGLDVSGGKIYPVEIRDDWFSAELVGPKNTLKKDKPTLTVPFTVDLDGESGAARIVIDGKELVLSVGEFSPWVEVSFDILGPLHSVKGICRFYLKSIEPHVGLYVSPVNIDPAHPALPISTPHDYASWLKRRIGFYYTQGMPEDTKALEWNVLSDDEFLAQTHIVFEERLRMLDAVLDRYEEGFLFFYVSTLDQSSHMLWRNMDPKHPAHTVEAARNMGAMEDLYARIDTVLATVERRMPADATLIVMSDHGFAPFYKKFNLNTWLLENGYLVLRHREEIEEHHLLGDVRWRRTRAYALGINGLYINLIGRERRGIVERGKEYESLIQEISSKLIEVVDPESGEHVISRVYRTDRVYHGSELENAPDLIIGYHRGYRCSDQSALGNFTKEILVPNRSKWSGDHCMATEEVPGVLLTNRKLIVANPDLTDLAVTILSLYGIEKPEEMVGEMILEPDAAEPAGLSRR